ncbi:RNA polymerase subunit sigma-70 [Kribbella sp. CA-253562]|uniref:RNA polymerase subunit sigma-70 n=1 Tax=Kribbella sp. CA-253562 TaxID=3239942 RepID=UPI003D922366
MTSSVLERARGGDEQAFQDLTAPYVRELHLHCYRMLGSVTDADDLIQEILLAAWSGLGGFAGRSSVRTWLYRIATNRCLNAIRNGKRRPPTEPIPPFDPPEPTRRGDITWLQPYPDAWLEQLPEDRTVRRETVELAFVTALQRVPPRQAAVLVLVDVLGFTTAEVADLMDTGPTAIKGALQRARAAMRREPGAVGKRPQGDAARDEAVVDKRRARSDATRAEAASSDEHVFSYATRTVIDAAQYDVIGEGREAGTEGVRFERRVSSCDGRVVVDSVPHTVNAEGSPAGKAQGGDSVPHTVNAEGSPAGNARGGARRRGAPASARVGEGGAASDAATATSGEWAVARRFAEAFVADDIEAVTRLLTDDAWLAMPPASHEYHGRAAIAEFLRASAAGRRGKRLRLDPSGCNFQPGFICYFVDDTTLWYTGRFVLTVRGDRISRITRFLEPALEKALPPPVDS